MIAAEASKLDTDRFRKVYALVNGGATAGERNAAKARATQMAAKAGLSLKEAASKMDTQPKPKPKVFDIFQGFDEWMEEKEPGYKVRRANEKAQKAAKDAIRRRDLLAKYGTEQALFARTERENLLMEAVREMAKWRDWTGNDGTVYTYADEIDGVRDFYRREHLTDRIVSAVTGAYPFPFNVAGAYDEYFDWQRLQRERELFLDGEWNHHREVEARIELLRDALDNQAVASWGDMDARMKWWDERMTHGSMMSGEEEGRLKDRIAADLKILRNLQPETNADQGRQTNAAKRDAVLSILDTEPNLSDRQIARRAGVSPQTVGNYRRRGG